MVNRAVSAWLNSTASPLTSTTPVNQMVGRSAEGRESLPRRAEVRRLLQNCAVKYQKLIGADDQSLAVFRGDGKSLGPCQFLGNPVRRFGLQTGDETGFIHKGRQSRKAQPRTGQKRFAYRALRSQDKPFRRMVLRHLFNTGLLACW